MSEFQNILKINFKKPIYNIIFLKDGRLSISLRDEGIIILNKKLYSIEMKIREPNLNFYNHSQLKNGNIIAYSSNIYIIKLISKNEYKIIQKINELSFINNIIELKNNKLIFNSRDGIYKIWELNDKNEYICKKTINYLKNLSKNDVSDNEIKFIKENKFVSGNISLKEIIFWEVNNDNNIKQINSITGFKTTKINNSAIIDNFLLIGELKNIALMAINMDNYRVSRFIIRDFDFISGILKLSNNNILIYSSGYKYKKIAEYKTEVIDQKFKLGLKEKQIFGTDFIEVIELKKNNGSIILLSNKEKIMLIK